MYRMATVLAPYASQPDLPQFHHQIDECADELGEIGELARARGIRLSTHVGQYTVLNSTRPDVRAAAAAELEIQAALSSPRLDIEIQKHKTGRSAQRRLVLPQTRAHADLVDPMGLEALLRYAGQGRSFDIMLEAKGKDLALLRLRAQLQARGWPTDSGYVITDTALTPAPA